MTSDPIYKDVCWECPECGWQNPYPREVLLTMPPKTRYNCHNCDYNILKTHSVTVDTFALNHPRGRAKK